MRAVIVGPENRTDKARWKQCVARRKSASSRIFNVQTCIAGTEPCRVIEGARLPKRLAVEIVGRVSPGIRDAEKLRVYEYTGRNELARLRDLLAARRGRKRAEKVVRSLAQ